MDEKEHIAIIAANIKRLIKEKGINQKILAKALDISPSTITEYMQLRTRPSHGVIQKMADYFGVLKSDIDTTWKTENSTNIYIEETVKTMERLEEPRQQIVLDTANAQLKEQEEAQKIKKLEDYRLSDEFLDEQISKASAYGGKPLSDNDKEFFKQLLKKTMEERIERGE